MAKSEGDLKAILQAAKQDALSGESSSRLAAERQDAMDYYLGDVSKDMPSIDGRSKAVSTDVSDTVDGLMPALMEIFCGSDEVVKFEPVGEEDVQAAEQETDYVNHVFMQKNPGFLVLYSFIKDALLSKNGIVKIVPEEYEQTQRKTYYDQPDDAFAIIKSEQGVEVVEHTPKPQPDGTTLHDVTVSCKYEKKKTCVYPVPPEEFGVARSLQSIRIQDANYCYHEVKRTQADLIAEGYDPEQIKKLPSYASPATTEENARDTVEDNAVSKGDEGLNKPMREIRITEHYIRTDYEREGDVRLYRAVTGGEQGEVLRYAKTNELAVVEEEWIPFAGMTPVIMTHRFFGRSIADLVMDIMRIKTALLRATLDNAYIANNPRAVVSETDANENTLDDLLVSRPGNIVRVRQNAAGAVAWQVTPTIGNHVYPLLEYQDLRLEQRTGVTRQGQGIDADALQNQSATAVNQLYSAAQARIKLIARIFAETGIKDLFWLLHATIRKHGQQAETVRLRNKWVTVDPRQFKNREDLTVNVGLGTGGKSEQIAQTMAVLNVQKEMLMGGLTEVVQPKHAYNSFKRMLKTLEWKDHESYAMDPESPEGMQAAQSKPPNPEMVKLEKEAELRREENQQKAQIETVQAQADIATSRDKLQGEMMRDEREFQFKRELAILEFQLKERESQREQERRDRETDAKVQVMREGHFQKTEFAAQTHEQKMEQSKGAE